MAAAATSSSLPSNDHPPSLHQSKLGNYEAESARLHGEIQRLQRSMAALQQTNQQQAEDLADAQEQLKHVNSTNHQFQRRALIATLDSSTNPERAALLQLQSELELQRRQVTQLENELLSSKASHEGRLEELQQEFVDKVRQMRATHEQQLVDMQLAKDDAEARLASLVDQAAVMEQQVQTYKERCGSQEKELEAMMKAKHAMGNQLQATQAKVTQLETEVVQLKSARQKLQQQLKAASHTTQHTTFNSTPHPSTPTLQSTQSTTSTTAVSSAHGFSATSSSHSLPTTSSFHSPSTVSSSHGPSTMPSSRIASTTSSSHSPSKDTVAAPLTPGSYVPSFLKRMIGTQPPSSCPPTGAVDADSGKHETLVPSTAVTTPATTPVTTSGRSVSVQPSGDLAQEPDQSVSCLDSRHDVMDGTHKKPAPAAHGSAGDVKRTVGEATQDGGEHHRCSGGVSGGWSEGERKELSGDWSEGERKELSGDWSEGERKELPGGWSQGERKELSGGWSEGESKGGDCGQRGLLGGDANKVVATGTPCGDVSTSGREVEVDDSIFDLMEAQLMKLSAVIRSQEESISELRQGMQQQELQQQKLVKENQMLQQSVQEWERWKALVLNQGRKAASSTASASASAPASASASASAISTKAPNSSAPLELLSGTSASGNAPNQTKAINRSSSEPMSSSLQHAGTDSRAGGRSINAASSSGVGYGGFPARHQHVHHMGSPAGSSNVVGQKPAMHARQYGRRAPQQAAVKKVASQGVVASKRRGVGTAPGLDQCDMNPPGTSGSGHSQHSSCSVPATMQEWSKVNAKTAVSRVMQSDFMQEMNAAFGGDLPRTGGASSFGQHGHKEGMEPQGLSYGRGNGNGISVLQSSAETRGPERRESVDVLDWKSGRTAWMGQGSSIAAAGQLQNSLLPMLLGPTAVGGQKYRGSGSNVQYR